MLWRASGPRRGSSSENCTKYPPEPPAHVGGLLLIAGPMGGSKGVPRTSEAKNLFYLDANLPACLEGSQTGDATPAAGAPCRADRPCRSSRSDRHDGPVAEGSVSIVETEEDAARLQRPGEGELGFVTQTTLSVDDTAGVIRALRDRFPRHHRAGGPNPSAMPPPTKPPGGGQAGWRPVPISS